MTKKARKGRKVKVISYWLLVIGFLFLTGGGFKLYRSLKNVIWSGEGRVNFLLIDGDIFLASFEPSQKQLVILEIPNNTEIEVTRGFGKYRIGALRELGELEEMDGELIRESVQEYFGVPVDGYIKIFNFQFFPQSGIPLRGTIFNAKRELLGVFRNLIFSREPKTNFSGWDFLRLWWEAGKVLPHQVKFVHLEELGALRSKILADGSKMWEVNQGRLGEWFQENFYEPKIREENLTIRVINITNHDGLATHVARIIGNMGGRVIEISNFPARLASQLEAGGQSPISNQCEVKSGKEKEDSFTVRKLLRTLGCQFVEGEESDGRVEVSVLVGEEYWQMLNER